MNDLNGDNPSWQKWIEEEWPRHKREVGVGMQKVDQMHTIIIAMHEDMKHLRKLDVLGAIVDALTELRGTLITTIAGKNVIDIATAKELMAQQQATYLTVIKTVTAIIKTLLWVIGALGAAFAGVKWLAPQVFG